MYDNIIVKGPLTGDLDQHSMGFLTSLGDPKPDRRFLSGEKRGALGKEIRDIVEFVYLPRGVLDLGSVYPPGELKGEG